MALLNFLWVQVKACRYPIDFVFSEIRHDTFYCLVQTAVINLESKFIYRLIDWSV